MRKESAVIIFKGLRVLRTNYYPCEKCTESGCWRNSFSSGNLKITGELSSVCCNELAGDCGDSEHLELIIEPEI